MIDLHSHILPGLDDGARDLDGALAIARDAVADGITAIAATPHVRTDYPTTLQQIADGTREVEHALREARIELRLIRGAEVAFDEVDTLLAGGELASYAFEGPSNHVLVEPPYFGWPMAFAAVISRVAAAGLIPLIAHPERNPDVQKDPSLVGDLIEAGAHVQVTAASVDGRLGRAARASSSQLISLGYVHVIASDAHSPGLRAVGLSDARSALGDEALAAWLTEDVPRAILAGEPLPPRPKSVGRRGLGRLFGR